MRSLHLFLDGLFLCIVASLANRNKRLFKRYGTICSERAGSNTSPVLYLALLVQNSEGGQGVRLALTALLYGFTEARGTKSSKAGGNSHTLARFMRHIC